MMSINCGSNTHPPVSLKLSASTKTVAAWVQLNAEQRNAEKRNFRTCCIALAHHSDAFSASPMLVPDTPLINLLPMARRDFLYLRLSSIRVLDMNWEPLKASRLLTSFIAAIFHPEP